MTGYAKPLPVPKPWSMKFWEAAKSNKYLIQNCKDCEKNIFHPRKFCPECGSDNLDWIEAKGTGKVYAHTITYFGAEDCFKNDYPYVLALVDLDEDIRVMTNIVQCDPTDVKIGMEVEVVFEKVSEEFSLPFFRPKS